MKIYLGHATSFDFQSELYEPIKNSELFACHEFILPHDTNDFINSKDIIKNADLFLADVSYPSTGLGIELGWANLFEIPVIAIHKTNCKPTSAIKIITDKIIPYTNENLIEIINQSFSNI